jgi:hypothetical protein
LRLLAASTLGLAFLSFGCTPSIGDSCTLSTDCSLQGDRLCDTSQPNGYCTIFNCTDYSCPDNAACVLFHANLQGCPYNDRVPSRTARSFCMKSCTSDSDCRTSDGYVCRDPRQPPWNGAILDDNQSERICIVPSIQGAPSPPTSSSAEPPVCQPGGPPVPPIDASTGYEPEDAGEGQDAGSDAGEAGGDAGADAAADAGVDAPADAEVDATVDAGPPEAGPG